MLNDFQNSFAGNLSGKFATYLRCDGIFKRFVVNLPVNLSVKEFWKSVIIWGRHGQEFSVLFFWLTVYINNTTCIVFLYLHDSQNTFKSRPTAQHRISNSYSDLSHSISFALVLFDRLHNFLLTYYCNVSMLCTDLHYSPTANLSKCDFSTAVHRLTK